jgi:opacity protein-like surface antigen
MLSFGLLCTGAQAGGLGVFGSYWNPSDGDETFGAGAKLRIGVEPFYFGVRGTYYDDITEDVGADDDDLQVIPVDVGAGLQFNIMDELQIYGGGGVTYFFLDADNGSIDDEVGWFLEAGVELGITSYMAVFGEAVWRSVEGTVDDDDIDTDRVDIDLDGLAFNVGLLFRW